MTNCLNCGKPIEAYTGRRTRKYCSPACKLAYFKKTKPKEPKYVLLSTHEAALERIKSLEAQISSIPPHGKETYTPRQDNGRKEQKNEPVAKNERPQRMPDENAFDYAFRINEWKKLQK